MSISKKISALLVMLLLGIVVNAQSQRNFIRTDVILDSAGSATMSTVKYFDGLDRLVSAGYCCTSATVGKAGIVQLSGRDFSCQYAYDLNGNITSLQRGGVTDLVAVRGGTVCNYGKIDNLTLSYIGNQLKSVTDLADDLTYSGAMDFRDGASAAAEYTYDANGNLTSDRNKGIVSITYNELNLPRKVSFGDGHETVYTYASDGTKLRTEYRLNNLGVLDREPLRVRSAAAGVANSAVITDEAVAPYTTLTRRDYCGNYVYCNGRLERVLTPGGYISGGEHHFYITDYQGNVRVVLDSAGRPVEVNSYYPYGALTGMGQSVQPYKYGAKELDRENGLNLYDSHARHYDPILGRTTTLDPKATEYYSISPYAWCAGNPVKFVDSDGRDISIAGKNNSNVTLTTDLIDISVDASSLGIDWGGRYTLGGEEILSASLDLVGIVDPSGTADFLNASLQVKNKDWVGATISAAGILPYIGDVAKVGKISKDVKTIDSAIDAVRTGKVIHGNSKNSSKAQHLYEIFNKETGEVVKTGISGGKISKSGKSYRATRQVNKWNKDLGEGVFDSRIIQNFPAGPNSRAAALKAEGENADRLRREGQLKYDKYHKYP